MVISASSVHSPFSLMRNTDFVLISPREKPQLSLLPSSSGFTSVSSHQPWWKIFSDKRVAAIAVAICLSAAERIAHEKSDRGRAELDGIPINLILRQKLKQTQG